MAKKDHPAWLKNAKDYIWLPYTQMQDAPPPLPVIGTKGEYIHLADGSALVDGIASWWTTCHGYNHPHIIKKMEEQLHTFPHVMFGGLTHEPACTLAERLVRITPSGLNHVFFSDSGSVAVEVAMKMAVQYWQNTGRQHKNKFVSFSHGYHGDTMGVMSLADPHEGMHKALNNYMPMQYVTPLPSDEYGFAEFDDLLAAEKRNIAALVMEPLVQCAGGMKFHSADILAEIYRLCKKHEILFVADEVATGFGRTGYMFACSEAAVTPDILCLGKALTGGTVSLAATLATGEIYDAFLSSSSATALMHGPTYMANPLACAAANASLDLFEREDRLADVEQIELHLTESLAPCRTLSVVKEVRVKGAIGVVQLHTMDYEKRAALREAFIKQGVWIRPLEDVVYLMPAFTIGKKELSLLTDAIYNVLAQTK